jgi:hypothetical protein
VPLAGNVPQRLKPINVQRLNAALEALLHPKSATQDEPTNTQDELTETFVPEIFGCVKLDVSLCTESRPDLIDFAAVQQGAK